MTTMDAIRARRGDTNTAAFNDAYLRAGRRQEFGALVYRLRTNAGFTQAELAEAMGTHQAAIARLEGGGSEPTFDTLDRLAAAVGVQLRLDVVGSDHEGLLLGEPATV